MIQPAMNPQPRIRVLATPQDVARFAADHLLDAARQAVAVNGSFSLALSGGSTPRLLYQLLAGEPYLSEFPWADTEIFFGDERCVPPDHPDSNYRMARETLLSKVPVPATSVHRMKGEIDPAAAAREYQQLLQERFGVGPGIDLVLLGLGEDAHTASIFPDTPAAGETAAWVLGYFAEKSSTGPSWRVTLTAPFINRSKEVVFLICGASKATPLQQVLEGPCNPQHLPAQLIRPASGQLLYVLDAAAADMDHD